jgi:DNA-binding response OmpR family regulator
MVFEVSDTGIGIKSGDQSKIFEEFTQIEHRLQRKVRGTGLGLPLSKRLAELLGGTLSVRSELGSGATFALRIPMHYKAAHAQPFEWIAEEGKAPVLVIDDAPEEQYFYQKALESSSFQIYPARALAEAENALRTITPVAVILDIMMGNEEGWDVLLRMKRDDRLSRVPVIVISALSEREKATALGADVYLPKPIDRRLLLETLEAANIRSSPIRVLAIDDDEAIRFLIRQCLSGPSFDVREALSGEDGLAMAQNDPPDIILLDLIMPGVDGYEVLAQLQTERATQAVPVLIVTSAALTADERDAVLTRANAYLPKSDVTRHTLTHAVRSLVAARASSRPDAGETPAPLPI